ncbi:hypothetical protein ACWEIJ_36645 [Lentzea sp. NPDC004789]
MFGLDGNDTACLGNDWADGEAVVDTLNGKAGDDTLLGDDGPDPSGLDVRDGGAGPADRCDSRFGSLSNREIIF